MARGSEVEVENRDEVATSEPLRFKVILLNDDYSTMEFVVEVLVEVFNKSFEEALNIMLDVHKKGMGVCGIYPYDIAETKVAQVKKRAKAAGYPLRAITEEC
ncbi:MAG: ATP-dependent Clp protease adaptor ClpS [Wolinella sp.]